MGSKRWYGHDTQLTLRMALTLFLLALLYAFFLVVLWQATGSLALLAVFGAGLLLFQYYASDKLVLLSTGAREVTPVEEPALHRIVDRLAQIADLPKPRVAIMETQAPNAFATGRNPTHAVVAVTRGLIQLLELRELEAVLAHELSHIKNRDMMVLTYASLFASVASFIVQMGMWTGFDTRGGRDRGNPMAVVLLVSALVWAVSFFLLRALSRYREYTADRGSVLITGSPSSMRSALIKVSGTMRRIPTTDLRAAQSMSAFFIVPAARHPAGELFATHPRLERRLERLEAMERTMNAVPS